MYLTGRQSKNKKLVTELASQMIGHAVMDLKELRGCISFNYLINGKYIFKLPSHRTETFFWEKQGHNLPKLQEQLSYQIPLPKITKLNFGKHQIIGYCYPKIEGKTLSKKEFQQCSLHQKIKFFENLSDAIAQLHNIDPSKLPEQTPTFSDLLISYFSSKKENNENYIKKIEDTFHQQDISLKKNTLCHLDLHSENIVLNDKNQIIGILDWDSLSLGEPFMEFHTGLYTQSDLKILRDIYQRKTQKEINPKKFQCMDNLYHQILGLFALGILTYRPTKFEVKTKNTLPRNWARILSQDTDRWPNLGRS